MAVGFCGVRNSFFVFLPNGELEYGPAQPNLYPRIINQFKISLYIGLGIIL